PARCNFEEQGVPNAPKVQPQIEVEKDKLKDREEFRNKKAKTSGNESGTPAPRNIGEFNNPNSENLRARPT
ncbi:hypothetical protein H5410_027207, partial [Solanum commersonii]